MTRGDDIDASDRRYRPFSRLPFFAGAILVVSTLLAWVGTALFALGDFGSYSSPCLLISVGLLLVGLAVPLAVSRHRTRRALKGWLGKNEEGLALLRAGRYDDAASIWDGLAENAKWAPAVHALLVHNLGVAALHMKRPKRALAMMNNVMESGWFRSGALSNVNTNLGVARALAHSIVGDLDAAERIRAEAASGLGESRRGATMLIDTMIGARRGTLGEPPTQEALRLAEASLMPTHVRAIPILYAFAKTTSEGSYRTAEEDAPRADGGGLAKGDLDFLAVEWPELAAYLEAHGLSGDN